MSAPEVGDRVRVIAGQWVGWEGLVLEDMGDGWRWLKVSVNPSGRSGDWQRPVHVVNLAKVATASVPAPQGDDEGSGAPVEAPAAEECPCCSCKCRCRVTPGSLGNVESWRCHLHGEAECDGWCDAL